MGERIMLPRLGWMRSRTASARAGSDFARFKLFQSVGSALAHGAQASSSPQRSVVCLVSETAVFLLTLLSFATAFRAGRCCNKGCRDPTPAPVLET
jgi:hypothetical protein